MHRFQRPYRLDIQPAIHAREHRRAS
jgi:hypothetical protein